MTIFGAILFALTTVTSCGGGKDSVSLTIDKVAITGDAKDYIQVVPGTYEVKKTKGTLGEELQVSLKLKVIKEYDQTKIDENTAIGNLSLQVTDDKGAPIDVDFSPAGTADWDKINSLLKGKIGTEVTVLFKPMGFGPDENLISEIFKNGKGLEITGADVTNPKTEPIIDNSPASDESDDSEASSPSGDCEQFCSDYESFVDEYISIMKKYKANPGDMSIMGDYTEIMQKASEMQESSKDCMGDPQFASRISKALQKMSKMM